MADADAVSVRVVARFRPFNAKEVAMHMSSNVYKFIGDECVNVNVSNCKSNHLGITRKHNYANSTV